MARRGRLGALALHARHDSQQIAQRARAAFLDRFPDDDARRQYFRQLAAKSVAARAARARRQGATTAVVS
jgi:hypothetical protein